MAITPSFPGATAPTLKPGVMIAQGVPSGNTTARLNEVPQVKKGLIWYNPQVAPFRRLIGKLKGSETVRNSRFYQLEKQKLPRSATIGSITGTATVPVTLVLGAGEGARFRAGDIVYNVTNDVAASVASVSADTLTVVTGEEQLGGTSGNWAATNQIINIGNAYEDGVGSGASLYVVEDEKLYHTQIFKDSIEMSDRYEQTELFEGDAWANAKRQLEFEHLLSLEYASFFGKRDLKQNASTKKFKTFMGGVRYYLNAGGGGSVNMGGAATFTKAEIDSILKDAMLEGHSGFENKELANKTFFGSMKWVAAFNALGDSVIRIHEPSEKTFGLRLTQYQGSWGVLNVLNSPVFNRTSTLQGMGTIIDLEHVRDANFKGRDTKFEEKLEANDLDGRKAQYKSDKSLIVEVAPAHTWLYGLTG